MRQAHPFPARAAWRRTPGALALVAALAACAAPIRPDSPAPPEPGRAEITRDGPEDAAPGTCWGRTISPAVVEQVSERVEIRPAKVNPDGTVAEPPVYRTQERQVIVTPRRDNWFEAPCPESFTPDFVASVQRALIARGIYAGPVTGTLDGPTRAAIRRFQQPSGPDSPVLSLTSARVLGLVAVPRTPAQ